jgi:hypothetical protein
MSKCEICGTEVPPVEVSATMVGHYKDKHPNRLSEVQPPAQAGSGTWGEAKPTSTVAPAVPPATTTKDKPSGKAWSDK